MGILFFYTFIPLYKSCLLWACLNSASVGMVSEHL